MSRLSLIFFIYSIFFNYTEAPQSYHGQRRAGLLECDKRVKLKYTEIFAGILNSTSSELTMNKRVKNSVYKVSSLFRFLI